ncbi:unnamed protein product, partial [Ectocarpus sp. 12 AP-2014]
PVTTCTVNPFQFPSLFPIATATAANGKLHHLVDGRQATHTHRAPSSCLSISKYTVVPYRCTRSRCFPFPVRVHVPDNCVNVPRLTQSQSAPATGPFDPPLVMFDEFHPALGEKNSTTR